MKLFTPQEARLLAFVAAMFLLGLAVQRCRRTGGDPPPPPAEAPAPETASPQSPGGAEDWEE